ncbi:MULTISPECIES: hypothetical protein [Flagellimonas]|uniref:HEPN domain-containing protein n=1 Tax=Flagellimonas hadalis TaxID=2597517 RepID=A0A5N5IRY3_9FLAO|nr:hypothetical protein [Allomuricauda hadalis]KAB5490968.1 hypothetical protein FOT42_005940 [Allomuricauda hadalis]
MDVRDSLNFHTYIEHSQSLLVAADCNLDLLKESFKNEPNDRIKSIGLFRSSKLLYAVSIELILKARGLFEERSSIKNGEIKSFNEYLNKWREKTNGHDFLKIIKKYNIEINEEDKSMLDEIAQFTSWAGRFPYPKNESTVIEMEKNGRNLGSIGLRYKVWANEFHKRQVYIMAG